MFISDGNGGYYVKETVSRETIINFAKKLVKPRRTQYFNSPQKVRDFLILELAEETEEYFCTAYLDTKHRLILFERTFTGTIDGASVHPRVVVKRALCQNAAAVIICHNHPSGVPEPSAADNALTRRLQGALAVVDIRLLDHIVIGGDEAVSFAERGLI